MDDREYAIVRRPSSIVHRPHLCERQRDAQHPRKHTYQPEAHGYLRLGPAYHLKVVVQWRHPEQALTAGQLEVEHLQYVRYSHRHEHQTNER